MKTWGASDGREVDGLERVRKWMAVGVGQLRRRAGAHPLPAAVGIRIVPKTKNDT